MQSFDDAEEKCQHVPGGHLAAFHSRQDFDFLFGLITSEFLIDIYVILI